LGFLFEMLIRFAEIGCIDTQRNRNTQNAVLTVSCGHNNFLTIEPGDFFIGQEMFGQFLRVFDNGLNQVAAPKLLLHPIPIIIVSPKHICQSPKRYIKPPQKQGLFYLLCLANKIRHHTARRNRENLLFPFPIEGFETNPAQSDILQLAGSAFIVQALTSTNCLWKQLWMFNDHLVNPFSIGTTIINNLSVLFQ
jgi:hypothetical protein